MPYQPNTSHEIGIQIPAAVKACCLLLCLVCLSLLPGCDKIRRSGHGGNTVASSTRQLAKESAKVKEFQKRLSELLKPVEYTYDPAGKPDPFQPFLQTAPVKPIQERLAGTNGMKKVNRRPEHCSTPLECMDVGQLTLVAIVIENNGKRIAMAQDAAGIGYILKPGIAIGYRGGHVKRILQDRVVVEEEVETIQGNQAKRDRILYLHPEEQQ